MITVCTLLTLIQILILDYIVLSDDLTKVFDFRKEG